MITTNIDISGRLVNWQIGSANHIEVKEKEVSTIYLALDDISTGQNRSNGNDDVTKNNRWVPTDKGEVSVYLRKYKTTSPAI